MFFHVWNRKFIKLRAQWHHGTKKRNKQIGEMSDVTARRSLTMPVQFTGSLVTLATPEQFIIIWLQERRREKDKAIFNKIWLHDAHLISVPPMQRRAPRVPNPPRYSQLNVHQETCTESVCVFRVFRVSHPHRAKKGK